MNEHTSATIKQTGDFFLSMNEWGITPILFFSVCIIILVIGVWLYFYARTFNQILKALENINHTIELNNKTNECIQQNRFTDIENELVVTFGEMEGEGERQLV